MNFFNILCKTLKNFSSKFAALGSRLLSLLVNLPLVKMKANCIYKIKVKILQRKQHGCVDLDLVTCFRAVVTGMHFLYILFITRRYSKNSYLWYFDHRIHAGSDTEV